MSDDEEQTRALRAKPLDSIHVDVHGLHFVLPASAISPTLLAELQEESKGLPPIQREDISFDLSPDERSYADWISRDIEATFGCERMPKEVGTLVVPDVAVGLRGLGEATLFDCLFSDHHRWVAAEPEEGWKTMPVDASRLPASFLPVATVLGAFHLLVLALHSRCASRGYFQIRTDGALHREDMLEALARLRPWPELPDMPQATAAAREIEALLAAWDGKSAPPDVMVAWASGFLGSLQERRGQ